MMQLHGEYTVQYKIMQSGGQDGQTGGQWHTRLTRFVDCAGAVQPSVLYAVQCVSSSYLGRNLGSTEPPLNHWSKETPFMRNDFSIRRDARVCFRCANVHCRLCEKLLNCSAHYMRMLRPHQITCN